MSKRFLSSMLLGLLFLVGASSMFTSCKDYDDDIKNLQEQIDQNAKAIDQIRNLVTDGSVISDVRKIADGIEIVMANGKTYTITNGTSATVWTIGDDGYWYKDGEKTNFYAIGKDGANGINGTNGTNGTNGKDGIYYVPNPETGCWDIYNADGTLKEKTNISWKASTNEITAVKDGSDLKLYNVRTSSGFADFTVALSNILRGFVFQPEIYVDGVPAIRVAQFGYNALNMTRMNNGKNGDGENGTQKGIEEYITSSTKTYKSRKTYVKYHVNPSNANVEDLQNLTFVVKANDEYIKTRAPKRAPASSDFDAEAKFHDFTNGILTVEVIVHGEPATGDNISVIALQTARQDGENVTSDYATVIKSNLNDIHIADKARNASKEDYHFRTILHSKDNSCEHIGIKNYAVSHKLDKDGETCDLQLKWNGELNIWDYVMAHEVGNPCIDATTSMAALGFTWKLDLVENFVFGSNETDQSEYVEFNETTGILKVKEKYGESAIDRTPIVRVRIMDGDKTVKVAYIKVKIVRTPEPLQNYAAFFNGVDFTFKCEQDAGQFVYDYKDFSISVLKPYHYSWDEFQSIYPLNKWEDYVANNGEKFVDYLNKNLTVTIDNNKANQREVGTVTQSNDLVEDPSEEGTVVLYWKISNDDLWKYAGETVYNVYRCWDAEHKHYFDIILKAKIKNINKTYVIDVNGKNGKYVENYWYDNFAYSKLNVNVPNPENTTDHTKCQFDVDLNTFFVSENGFIKVNVANDQFPISNMRYYFCNDIKNFNSNLNVKNNGTELWWGNSEKIAWLENAPTYNKFRYNKDSDKAKELLNRDKEYMQVYIGATGYVCGKYQVNFTFRGGADHFVAKVIRPVTLEGNNVHPDYFIDGVDYGEAHSYIDIDQFLNRLYDWRNRDFVNHPSFWEYYGPFSCTFNTSTAICNLKVDGNTSWKPLPSTINFSFDRTIGGSNRFGWLTYKNNGANVDEDFDIKVDLKIHYGWGTYEIKDVTIHVQSTKNTPAP